MAYHLLTAVAAFIVGLTVGSLALGQKQESTSSAETQYATGQDSAAALAISRTSVDDPDTSSSGQDSEPPTLDTGDGDEDAVSLELGPISEAGQIRVLTARWTNLESLVNRLAKRVRGLERELMTLKSERWSKREEVTEAERDALPVATPEDRRTALVAAGVPRAVAEEIVWRQSELELDRLELHDLAMREGWYQTNRYYKALRELNGDAIDLRAEIGEQAYDQFLYQTGEPNRVKVESVIQGSAAEQFGLLPGDIIERYGDERIFESSDLRNATTLGTRDETVPVVIRRGGRLVEIFMSRGPMGVQLERETAPPGG